jgi:hypothetical protein
MIDNFLYTDTRLCWILAPTLLLLLSASSGNNPENGEKWISYSQVVGIGQPKATRY